MMLQLSRPVALGQCPGISMECHEACDQYCLALVGTTGFTAENCCTEQCSVPSVEGTTFDLSLIERAGGCEILRQEIAAYEEPAPRGRGGIMTEEESRIVNAALAAGTLHLDVLGRAVDASGALIDPAALASGAVTLPAVAAPGPAGGGVLAEQLAQQQRVAAGVPAGGSTVVTGAATELDGGGGLSKYGLPLAIAAGLFMFLRKS